MQNYSRRLLLKNLGLTLALPVLNTFTPLTAFGQVAGQRKNFIGVYFPNGSHFPVGDEIGAWRWNDAGGVLYPLKEGTDRVDNNVMIIRKISNGFADLDPHWQNCAAFLSSGRINLDLQNVRCAKSIDQIIADTKTTPLRSIEIGAPYYHQHLLADHPTYSHLYMNRIAWRNDSTPLTPQINPMTVFNNLFGGGIQSNRQLVYLNSKKKSILDGLVADLVAIKNKTSADGKIALEEYETSLRDIEKGLTVTPPVCTSPGAPALNYEDINVNYINRIEQLQRMLVFAMKCNLTNVGTIMYSPGVSELLSYSGDLGGGGSHHGVAHHGEVISSIERLKTVNRMHIRLLKHLVNLLKSNNLLAESLVLYGTDMSDGNIHATNSIPSLLCGQGADLKFGQEINFAAQQTHSKLLNSVLSFYGVTLPSIGTGILNSNQNLNTAIKV